MFLLVWAKKRKENEKIVCNEHEKLFMIQSSRSVCAHYQHRIDSTVEKIYYDMIGVYPVSFAMSGKKGNREKNLCMGKTLCN